MVCWWRSEREFVPENTRWCVAKIHPKLNLNKARERNSTWFCFTGPHDTRTWVWCVFLLFQCSLRWHFRYASCKRFCSVPQVFSNRFRCNRCWKVSCGKETRAISGESFQVDNELTSHDAPILGATCVSHRWFCLSPERSLATRLFVDREWTAWWSLFLLRSMLLVECGLPQNKLDGRRQNVGLTATSVPEAWWIEITTNYWVGLWDRPFIRFGHVAPRTSYNSPTAFVNHSQDSNRLVAISRQKKTAIRWGTTKKGFDESLWSRAQFSVRFRKNDCLVDLYSVLCLSSLHTGHWNGWRLGCVAHYRDLLPRR